MSTVASKEKKSVSVSPFTVQITHPRNCDVAIQSLGIVLRGAVSATVEIFDKQWKEEDFDNEQKTRPTGAKLIEGVGEIPGMELHIDPAGLRWKAVDPLYKNEKLLDRVQKAMRRAGVGVADKLGGIAPREGRVDVHTMKTLCRELLCFIEAGEVKIAKGIAPTREDVEELPGYFLQNASNVMGWHQPRFEKDMEKWGDRMSSITGGD